MSTDTNTFSQWKLASLIGGAILLVLGIITACECWVNLDASQIMVIQSPLSGNLSVYTDPGVRWQGFGKVTKYPRRVQYSFSSAKNQGKSIDESISTRFNDGGNGKLSGVVSWEMPLGTPQVIQLHKEFGSMEAIEQQLIRPMIEKVVYNVGPTMSSTESSAERRPEIPQYIDDQLQNGPYLTQTKSIMQKDPLTNSDKEVRIVEIVMGSDGLPKRTAASQITEHGIKLYPVTIDSIGYDPIVEAQIAERQKATTQVQIAQANARKAEQDAITTAKQGEASAAKAKWEQETINAKEIAEAEKNKQVASLAAQQADAYKQQQILIGEGDAERKRLVMAADGALETKLSTYVTVNKAYADAIARYQGNWVPTTILGGGAASVNGASQLVDLLTAKTARDLALDLSVGGNTKQTPTK